MDIVTKCAKYQPGKNDLQNFPNKFSPSTGAMISLPGRHDLAGPDLGKFHQDQETFRCLGKFVALFLATHFSPGAMISLPGRHDLAGPDLVKFHQVSMLPRCEPGNFCLEFFADHFSTNHGTGFAWRETSRYPIGH